VYYIRNTVKATEAFDSETSAIGSLGKHGGKAMAPFEYLLLFASVVLGLALAELAVGVNRLLRDWDRVKWDWLAPMAAALAFLKIVTQWWTWHSVERFAAGLTFEMFLTVLIGTMLVFLISATPLPEVAEDGIDLRKHWDRVGKRYWSLFLIHWLLSTSVSLWAQVMILHRTLNLFTPVMLLGPVMLVLILVRNRWVQAAGILLFAGLFLWQSGGTTLSN
jgi:hypothetical protein